MNVCLFVCGFALLVNAPRLIVLSDLAKHMRPILLRGSLENRTFLTVGFAHGFVAGAASQIASTVLAVLVCVCSCVVWHSLSVCHRCSCSSGL
jgi:hypothetical protein